MSLLSGTEDPAQVSPPTGDPLKDFFLRKYGGRCGICLNLKPEGDCEYMPLISPEDGPIDSHVRIFVEIVYVKS